MSDKRPPRGPRVLTEDAAPAAPRPVYQPEPQRAAPQAGYRRDNDDDDDDGRYKKRRRESFLGDIFDF